MVARGGLVFVSNVGGFVLVDGLVIAHLPICYTTNQSTNSTIIHLQYENRQKGKLYDTTQYPNCLGYYIFILILIKVANQHKVNL